MATKRMIEGVLSVISSTDQYVQSAVEDKNTILNMLDTYIEKVEHEASETLDMLVQHGGDGYADEFVDNFFIYMAKSVPSETVLTSDDGEELVLVEMASTVEDNELQEYANAGYKAFYDTDGTCFMVQKGNGGTGNSPDYDEDNSGIVQQDDDDNGEQEHDTQGESFEETMGLGDTKRAGADNRRVESFPNSVRTGNGDRPVLQTLGGADNGTGSTVHGGEEGTSMVQAIANAQHQTQQVVGKIPLDIQGSL